MSAGSRAVATALTVVLSFPSAGSAGPSPEGGTGETAIPRVTVSYRADLQPRVDALAEEQLPGLLEFYRECHARPELSGHEKETPARLAARLRAAGVEVTEGVGGNGVVGVLRKGGPATKAGAGGPSSIPLEGPVILVRTDMDALPVTEKTGLPYASRVKTRAEDGSETGVMHACGHDLHMTVLAGVARILALLGDSWRGTVVFVGQPAEETGAGSQAMIRDGLFERFPRPNACLALHCAADFPVGSVRYAEGWVSANADAVEIVVHGKGGHGAAPHRCADPVVAAAHVILALQTLVSRRLDPIEDAVVTVGSIHGGTKSNVIPDEVKLQVTVRSFNDGTRRMLLDGVRQIATDVCRALGCPQPPDVLVKADELGYYTPAGYHDPAFTASAAEVFRAVLGPDAVSKDVPSMGGDDYARFGHTLKVPSLLFGLGTIDRARWEAAKASGESLPTLHSPLYAPDAGPAVRAGVRTMASLVLSLLDLPR